MIAAWKSLSGNSSIWFIWALEFPNEIFLLSDNEYSELGMKGSKEIKRSILEILDIVKGLGDVAQCIHIVGVYSLFYSRNSSNRHS